MSSQSGTLYPPGVRVVGGNIRKLLGI